ncbi:MAG TPA: ATP-binding protein [Actinomycetota bacterium]|nr:ATP-binding protein [Actinomycetota bacterium]
MRLPASARAPAEAREAIARMELGLDRDELDAIRLLISELVTNSVRHAGLDPEDYIDLDVDVGSEAVRVSVTDPGSGFVSRPRDPSPAEPSGWGLFLVQRVADRWGVSTDGRTSVWFELRRSSP